MSLDKKAEITNCKCKQVTKLDPYFLLVILYTILIHTATEDAQFSHFPERRKTDAVKTYAANTTTLKLR